MHPYRNLPETAFWAPSVTRRQPLQISGLASSKNLLQLSDRIGTAGSCFAQHMARHLRQRGFTFVDVEPGPPFVSAADRKKYNFGVYSARYANIYTPTQLRQLIERAYQIRKPVDSVWMAGDRFHDPFRTQIEPGGYVSEEEMLADRESHLACVRRLFRKINVFVFTLGLTEAWQSKIDGSVFPIAPGVSGIGKFDPEKYEFVNFGFEKVRDDLIWCMKVLKRRNPDLRFILTVSPVPLAATASQQHVLAATIYSKSVLRAVAGELAASRDDVEYFPSFEIISSFPFRGMFYEEDLREVTEDGVTHVMETFVREFCSTETPVGAMAQDDDSEEDSDAVCEESILSSLAENRARGHESVRIDRRFPRGNLHEGSQGTWRERLYRRWFGRGRKKVS